jgi:hypothetical protein
MANLSAHLINKFYTDYSSREIAFNKSVIRITGLEPQKVFLKIKGEQWSCVIYSCSMKSAKVIANMDAQSFEAINKSKNNINLRLSFLPPEHKNSIVFFIPSHVDGYRNFNSKNANTHLLSLSFTQKPPDDLIEILGKLILEKDNFEKRKDVRISLDGKIIWDFGLSSNRSVVIIDNIKRPAIIKNLSASGALIIMSCHPKFIMNKKAEIILPLIKNNLKLTIEGEIVRNENIEGRKDIFGIGINFDFEKIPMEYKQLINNYLDKLEGIAKHNK